MPIWWIPTVVNSFIWSVIVVDFVMLHFMIYCTFLAFWLPFNKINIFFYVIHKDKAKYSFVITIKKASKNTSHSL